MLQNINPNSIKLPNNVRTQYESVNISILTAHEKNSRLHSEEQIDQICGSITEFGFTNPVLIDENNIIIAGHGRTKAALKLGYTEVPCIRIYNLTESQKRAYVIMDNQIALNSSWDEDMLKQELENLQLMDFDTSLLAFDTTFLEDLFNPVSENKNEKIVGNLSNKFLIPPFSIINTREGWWKDRKRNWISIGIKSELGRANTFEGLGNVHKLQTGQAAPNWVTTSIFDPVLCEIAYRWFSKPDAVVLDPFAGGSVRGIVAAKLGRKYVGIELRKEQVDSNIDQWANLPNKEKIDIAENSIPDNIVELTPIEQHGSIFVKRDDLFRIGGGCGGKVRSCWQLAQGAKGLTTAGSRFSPQINIVAQIAKRLGIPCVAHTPQGELSPELLLAQKAGAEIIQHKAGYNNVIISRSKQYAEEHGFTDIPFGMECVEAITQTRQQVRNIPANISRIVMPVGSGMSLAGVLHGLNDIGLTIPVIGVRVGADPTERLNKYAPANWKDMVTIVSSHLGYDDRAEITVMNNVNLDPYYEAKCLPFLQAGDLFWIVGIRNSELPNADNVATAPIWICEDSKNILNVCNGLKADFIFSCPPYANLEVYSDDPRDISNMGYEQFKDSYFEIIAKACSLLKNNRFACFVVGEVRDKNGHYYNFVGETVSAFWAAGLEYYNEIILVNNIGTLPIRAGKTFSSGRKIGKCHQNVLVFVKGDAKIATEECGLIEFDDVLKLYENEETDDNVGEYYGDE